MDTSIWPNFYVVGGVKCGTTSLYANLKKHPQVFLPEWKEPHYFRSISLPPQREFEHCTGNLEVYQRLYRGAEHFPAIGDTSPSYLWDETVPGKIYQVSPRARIIMVLRDPVARAYSEYLMSLMNGNESLPFGQALREDLAEGDKVRWDSRMYIRKGLYHDQVRRYFDTFGREQVLVLLTEEMNKMPQETYSKIAIHIGVDPTVFKELEDPEVLNQFRMPRSLTLFHLLNSPSSQKLKRLLLPDSLRKRLRESHMLHYSPLLYKTTKPPIDPASRRFLQDLFEPDVCKLEELLGRKLPELRKSWIQ